MSHKNSRPWPAQVAVDAEMQTEAWGVADGPQMGAVIYWERQAPTNTCISVGGVGTGVRPTYAVGQEDDKLTSGHRRAALDEWVRRSCYANLTDRVLELITRWMGKKRTGAGLPRDGGQVSAYVSGSGFFVYEAPQ